MIWIRIDDHRINVEEIVRYSKALESDTMPGFKTEIVLSDGSSFFVTATPEEVDAYITSVNAAQK